jgi:acetate kinase
MSDGTEASRAARGTLPSGRVLTVNTGSSSLKSAVYDAEKDGGRIASFDVTRIGTPDALIRSGATRAEDSHSEPVADHSAALQLLVDWLQEHGYDRELVGVGHRVVHGGPRYSSPEEVSGALVDELTRLVPIDPMHLPQAIAAIEDLRRRFPHLPQVACFDTAFHRTMPPVAQTYALPLDLREAGIVRYGFHGLSYEYVLSRVRQADPGAAQGRMVVAHLGNGASMAAVSGGRSVDTTMGFTPTGGLVMGTRTGDLDPGVVLYLLQGLGMTPAEVNSLVNNGSGLLALSGVTADMQDLLERRDHDRAAALAVDVFCHTARKFVGALAASLGGMETLIFTGGIGEHSSEVRAAICRGLEFVGVSLDERQNEAHGDVISRAGSRVTVRVVQTDEDSMIAAHTLRLLRRGGDARVRV